MRALIDFDIICYTCGFAVEQTFWDVYLLDGGEELLVKTFLKKREALEWVAGESNYSIVPRVEAEPIENALQAVRVKLHDILSAVKAEEYIGYLTGNSNFRDEVAVTRPYKGNRDKNHKPAHYKEIREYLIRHHNGVVVEGIEADDALGIAQCAEEDNTIICTIDKDLDQIPGWHYNWTKREKYFIDPLNGMYNFYYQMLTGDSVDNIIGVRGCGPATAKKLLAGCLTEEEMYSVVYREYEMEYEDQADIIMQEMADLLYIRKYPEERWLFENNNRSPGSSVRTKVSNH
jgi:hypothetical protein